MTPKTCYNHRQRDKQIKRLKREHITYKLENKACHIFYLRQKKVVGGWWTQ